MCASRSAGASLTPSPVMATTAPRAFQARTMRSLSSGVARACTTLGRVARRRRRCPSRGDGARGGRMVAGDHHGADARPRAPRPPPRWPRLRGGSASPTRPSSAQVALLCAVAHRDGQNAQAARRPSATLASTAAVARMPHSGSTTSNAPFTYRTPSARGSTCACASASKGSVARRGAVALDVARWMPRARRPRRGWPARWDRPTPLRPSAPSSASQQAAAAASTAP